MEQAVVSYAEGVAKALVGKLGLLLSEEYKLLRGVRGEVIFLRDDVAIVNSLLRMLAEADDGTVNHFVREWMKQVRELAYDAEDNIDLFARRISCIAPVTWRLGGVWRLWVTLHARHRLGCDIKDLRARALAISERRTRYGIDSQAMQPSAFFAPCNFSLAIVSGGGEANSPAANRLVGIEDQVKSLVKKVNHADNDKQLKVFSIVGFGGLGKTTLAMEVCRRLEDKFHCQATVSISQAFDASKDMGELLKSMLQQVLKIKRGQKHKGTQDEELEHVDNLGVKNESELKEALKTHLKDKRYLVVIDDIWTISAWNSIQNKLLEIENNLDSRIIVTTRIEGVAKACSTPSARACIHKMKPLELEDSTKLFEDRVFGPNNATCPDQLKETMMDILKKCGGLPLAIVSIASLLASYRSPGSIELWKRICNSIGSQMDSNPTLEGMRQIISLSYNHLPHHLKACMMYLSIFPEDYVIKKKRILHRWVAEGLVLEKRGLTLLEVAEAYFDELMSRNMVDATNIRHDGAIRACRVHDMMLEVIVSKALEENFVTLVGGQCGRTSYDRLRRLSMHGDYPWHGIEGTMDVQHVRSLSTFRPRGHSGMLNRLAEFTLLRVLDLEGCKDVQNRHMNHVCGLFLLTFLSLRVTDVSVMPTRIGRLQHLQTLNLHGTLLQDLPVSVTNLVKLENLYFTNKKEAHTLWTLPRGLSKMKALRLARKVNLGDDVEVAQEFGNLAQLQDIEFVLHSSNPEVLGALAHSLSRTSSLQTLKLADHSSTDTKMNFLLRLPTPVSPPQLLRSLRIEGRMDKLPDWIKSLKHLVTIKLCYLAIDGEQLFRVLSELPSLMRIDIESGAVAKNCLTASACFQFRVLKELRVTPYLNWMPRHIIFELGAMPALEMLVLRVNTRSSLWMKSIQGLEHLTSLKEVKLLVGKKYKELLDEPESLVKDENKRRSKANLEQIKIVVQYQ